MMSSGFFCAFAQALGGHRENRRELVLAIGRHASMPPWEWRKSAVLAENFARRLENSASTAENGTCGAKVSVICLFFCLGRFFFFSLQVGKSYLTNT